MVSFDVDRSKENVVIKMVGKLSEYDQEHPSFNVVAWYGNYAPFKYKLERFINSGTVDPDQAIRQLITS